MREIARELVKIARGLVASELDGKSKQQAKRVVNKLLYRLSKGIYSDDNWAGVNRVWKEFEHMGLDWDISGSKYTHNEDGVPTGKTWTFEITFIDNKGKKRVLPGILTAAGAGSVEDPLDKYDITAYVS